MQVFGLVGNPVGHSVSPQMHEAAFEARGMTARYVTFEPEPAALGAAIDGADALGLAGLNVTIPFKRAVREFVDVDDRAARVGAVNTVDFGTAPPTGHNTDVDGVRRALRHHEVAIDGAEAVVVGAGGAGRAAASALAEAGASVHVANRTTQKARDLAEAVGGTAGGLDTLSASVPEADILVNATSVGMESNESPVDADLLHGDLAVLDAVYAPLDTRLLRDAEAAGARTIDGAWMLLYQGIAAFELWTGREAPTGAMNEALRAALAGTD